jgi:hypothetical protein|tara:strand:- start:813 stop:2084 length:1272 start_codon:yes stop_codon:yes gene_type:complete
MNLLTKLGILLVHIDQETILNYFGISNPNLIDPDYQILYGTMDMAPVSTNVSMETLRIIVQSVIDYSRQGLSLVDIENICLFLTLIRFIVLAIKYNIKTSFYICCISIFAAGLWYLHSKDIFNDYGQFIKALKLKGLTRAADESYRALQSDIMGFKGTLVTQYRDQLGGKFDFDESEVSSAHDMFNLKFALVKSSEQNGHRIDPISMLFSRMPGALRPMTDKFYYVIFDTVLPQIFNKLIFALKVMGPIMAWVYVTRVFKRFCPYLIRWHWTMVLTWDWIERYMFQFIIRMSIYGNKLQAMGNYDKPAVIALALRCLFYMEFLFIFYALIHALFSQYFYIPFLTENTELHIGPRPKDSVYSGGYTDWQEYRKQWSPYGMEGRNKSGPIKIWYGWFGKDRQIPKKLKNSTQRFFKKLRRLFFSR